MKRSKELESVLHYVCITPPPFVAVPKNRVATMLLRIWRWL
jgi:hypothetical protein